MAGLDQQALAIVEGCLDLDGAEREQFVAGRCGTSPELRARVERMLAMDRTGLRLLPTEPIGEAEARPDPPPDRIGPFRVIDTIGRGGMGTVLLAERDDGVYRQKVAIKLIRAGLKDARAEERFALERQILARLSHPGIARILDGGAVEGRPYLVMDYVEGRPVTEHLEARDAGLTETLRLFEAVCEAVGHAHRNLVVHADIKPQNVLAAQDGSVKLLDFGVSRLTAGLDADAIDGPYPLTRGYAAPERLGGAPPTVAGDVYSLGALLHEMLTGERPDPDGEPMSAVAARARSRIPHRLLQGDLDAITAKALAADPERRYPDVGALLADLHRYESKLPVLARGGGRRYRASRFVARHRQGLALTVLAMIALVVATAVATSLYLEAERARGEAERRFEEVRGLARFMLFDLYDALRDAPGTVGARVAIADTSGRYLDRLRQVPDAPADLRLDSAIGYRRLATVQGMSGTASLGETRKAIRSLVAAEGLLRSVLAEQPNNAAALEEMGWVAASRWVVSSPKADEAAAQHRTARAFFDAALARDPGRLGARLGLLTVRRNQAFDLIFADKPREALAILRPALAEVRRLRWSRREAGDARLLEVNLLNRLGDATYYAGDMPGALPYYREADRIVSAQLAAGETAQWLDRRGETMWNISGTLNDLGRAAEALGPARAGIATMERLLQYGPDSNAEKRLLILYGQEAHILSDLGRPVEAAAASGRSAAMRERRLRAEPNEAQRVRDLAVHLPGYSDMLARVGDRNGACRAAARAVALWDGLRRTRQLNGIDAAREAPSAQAAQRRHCGSGGTPVQPS